MSESRETTSADMRYAILSLTVDSASGRTEETYLFPDICTKCKCLGKDKKCTMLPQANRASIG